MQAARGVEPYRLACEWGGCFPSEGTAYQSAHRLNPSRLISPTPHSRNASCRCGPPSKLSGIVAASQTEEAHDRCRRWSGKRTPKHR